MKYTIEPIEGGTGRFTVTAWRGRWFWQRAVAQAIVVEYDRLRAGYQYLTEKAYRYAATGRDVDADVYKAFRDRVERETQERALQREIEAAQRLEAARKREWTSPPELPTAQIGSSRTLTVAPAFLVAFTVVVGASVVTTLLFDLSATQSVLSGVVWSLAGNVVGQRLIARHRKRQ